MHRVCLQKSSALHSIGCSAACKGLDCLKKRLFASPVTFLTVLLAHWALVPLTQDQPTALSSAYRELQGIGRCVCSMSDQSLAPTLQLYSYVNHSGSCMWKIKRVVFTSTVKVANPSRFTLDPIQSLLLSPGILLPVFRGLQARTWWSEFWTAFLLKSWTLCTGQASCHLKANSLDYFVFIVVVEFFMPKHWHLKNFSTYKC